MMKISVLRYPAGRFFATKDCKTADYLIKYFYLLSTMASPGGKLSSDSETDEECGQ